MIRHAQKRSWLWEKRTKTEMPPTMNSPLAQIFVTLTLDFMLRLAIIALARAMNIALRPSALAAAGFRKPLFLEGQCL